MAGIPWGGRPAGPPGARHLIVRAREGRPLLAGGGSVRLFPLRPHHLEGAVIILGGVGGNVIRRRGPAFVTIDAAAPPAEIRLAAELHAAAFGPGHLHFHGVTEAQDPPVTGPVPGAVMSLIHARHQPLQPAMMAGDAAAP